MEKDAHTGHHRPRTSRGPQREEGNLPYPMRASADEGFPVYPGASRTAGPWVGSGAVTETSEPSQRELETNTFVAFADMDGSPTKAWLVHHRHDEEGKDTYNSRVRETPWRRTL